MSFGSFLEFSVSFSEFWLSDNSDEENLCKRLVLLSLEADSCFCWWRWVDIRLALTATRFPAIPFITGWYAATFGYLIMV